MLLCDGALVELSVSADTDDTVGMSFENVNASVVARRAMRLSSLFNVKKNCMRTGWVICDNGEVPLAARFTC